MNRRLADRPFLAGEYSIADMACVGWIVPYERQGQNLDDFPNLRRWFDAMKARPAVVKGIDIGKDERARTDLSNDKEAQKILFGQKAR